MPRRTSLPAAAVAGLVLFLAPAADAFRVTVPLDRTGRVPGTIRLNVDRVEAPGPGAVFAVAGGPGQSATNLTGAFAADFGGIPGARDVVVMDQRGTGKSGALNCPNLEVNRPGDRPLPERAAACAARLGPRRAFYTTRDSVEDLEAVRRRVGVDRITLYGVSYGTKVAVAYALRHPDHVERLVLDSVVEPEGQDIFDLDTFAALPRVLAEICRGECGRVTADLSADLAVVAHRMRGGPLRGVVVDGRGRPRTRTMSLRDLYDLLRAADFQPELRAEYPPAIRSAAEGDPAPLLRVQHRYDGLGQGGPPPEPQVDLLSFTSSTATLCEEAPLPWERTTPFAERPAAARARAAAIPEGRFEPFTRAMTLASRTDTISSCLRWPAAPEAPALAPGPPPDVPVLVLEGAEDLRTPLEVGARLAARFPHAQVALVPKTGHAVLGQARCAHTLLARFFADRPLGRPCAGRRRGAGVLPKLPFRLSSVAPAPGTAGGPGRTVAAVALTVADVYDEHKRLALGGDTVRAGGLRGGRFAAQGSMLRLTRVSLVAGVQVSGTLTIARGRAGRLTVAGPAAAAGTLTLRRGRLAGRVGGRAVNARLPTRR